MRVMVVGKRDVFTPVTELEVCVERLWDDVIVMMAEIMHVLEWGHLRVWIVHVMRESMEVMSRVTLVIDDMTLDVFVVVWCWVHRVG